MSKEIDEKVVSMQFDNRHFEKNVQTTMSTLDKLKAKLHLPGASKALQDVDAAARKIDISPLGKAAETVGLKFNAMYTIADQAFRNMTNSAMAAGKKIISALTIDPVKTGFNEYELKMDSVKTIMASTGESIETVNKYLEELNKYSDQTIYSFSDMTQNIGKFTNAGVKLEDAVLAIKGISNEAALSGANANEASRAMYNFAQALSVGYIQRIDWKSIELANMATLEFKQQLLDAAIAAGTVKKSADGMYETLAHPGKAYNASAMFTETLDDQWLTTEVLIETLKDYSDATTDIGKRAFAAAQDVTKLSQMFDVLKETAQSGWARTWEILVGDLNQAKALFTPLTDFFSKVINGINDTRNAILESAFGRSFKALLEPLKSVKKTIDTISEPIKTITKSLEDYNKVVKEVISGDWGNTEKRWNALTEAGYDWKTVQNMVNEELGCSLRRTTDFTFEQGEMEKATDKVTESNNEYIASLAKKSDEELRALGLNEEQINAIKQIRKEADKLGMSVDEFINNIDKIDGRWVILEAFKNVGKALAKVFKTVGQAWKEIFPPKSTEEKANALYNLMAAFHKFSRSLTMSDDTANKLKRTLKGVFAIIDIITTITGGAFKIAFKIVTSILGAFNLNILDVTAAIGDAVVAVRDWIDAHNIFEKGIGVLIPVLKKAVSAVRDWIKGFKETDDIPGYIIRGLVNGIKNGIKTVAEIFVKLGRTILDTVKGVLGIHSPSREFFEIGVNIIEGLVNGLQAAASAVWKALKKIAKSIVNFFKGDVASAEGEAVDSANNIVVKKAKEGGESFMSSFGDGIKSGLKGLWDLVKTIGSKLIEFIKDLDVGTVIAGVIGGGIIAIGVKVASALQSFGAMFEGLGDMFEGAGEFLRDFGKGLKSFLKGAALNLQAKAILSFAIAIGILAVALIALTTIDQGKLWASVGVIAALAAIMAALAFAASKMGEIKNVAKQSVAILALSIAMLLLAKMLNTLANLKMDDIPTVLAGLIMIMGSLMLVLVAFDKLGKYSVHASKTGSLLLKFAIALFIMLGVIKLAGKLDESEIEKGVKVIGAMSIFAAGLIAVSYFAGQYASKAGGMLLKFSIALLIMVGVIKLIGSMEADAIKKGLVVVAALEALAAGMIAASHLAGENADKAGVMMLAIATALLIMATVIKIVGGMEVTELVKGLIVIAVLEKFTQQLIGVSGKAGPDAIKAGVMLLAVAGAIGILTGVIFLLSLLDIGSIIKGTAVIVALEACFAVLIAITRFAKDTDNMKSMLITMTVAIGLLSVALIALSFIEPSRLAGATAALVLTMGAFALMIGITKIAGDIKIKTLISLVAVTGILAGLVGVLSLLKASSAAKSAIGLSALLIAMAVVTNILSKTNTNIKNAAKGAVALSTMTAPLLALVVVLMAMKNVKTSAANVVALITLATAAAALLVPLSVIGNNATDALKGVLALTTMAVPLLAFVGVLAVMDNVSNALSNVVALTLFAGLLTLLLIPLTIIGSFVSSALSGVLALTALSVPLLAFVGVLALMALIPDAMQNALALGELMVALSAVLVAISLVGPIAGMGITALTSLLGVMAVVGTLATVLGGIVTLFPSLQKFLDAGIDLLIGLAEGIGKILGAFISGIIEGIVDILPMLATQLSDFITNLQPFIKQVSEVDEKVIVGAGILAGAIIALSVADLISGLLTLGGLGLAAIGMQLSEFGDNLKPFLKMMEEVKPEAIQGVQNIANAILILTSANLLDGIARFFGSEGSLTEFANQMPNLGTGLRGFLDGVGTLSDDEAKTIECASKAVTALALAADAVPNTGGLLGALVGENDLGAFADQFPKVGTGIRSFLSSLGTFTDAEVNTVTAGANAVKALASAAKEIPNTGGLLAELVGDNDIGTFANKFPILGAGIRGFLNSLGTFTDAEVKTVECGANAVKLFAKAAKDIPNTGGLVAEFTGDNDLKDFANKIPFVGDGIKAFLNSMGTFTDAEVKTVECGVDAVRAFVEVAQDIPNTGGLLSAFTGDNDLEDFADEIPEVGKGLKNFSKELGTFSYDKLESMKIAVDALRAITELGNTDFDSCLSNMEAFTFLTPLLGEMMPVIVDAMTNFTASAGAINQFGLDTGIASVTKLIEMLKIMPSQGLERVFVGADKLKDNLILLAEGVAEFSNQTSGWSESDCQNGVVVARKVLSLKDNVPEGGLSNVLPNAYAFKNNITEFTAGVVKFITDLGNFNATAVHNIVTNVKEALTALGELSTEDLVLSFDNSASEVTEAINNMLTASVTEINDMEDEFYDAATSLATKLADGLSDNLDPVTTAVEDLVSAAATEANAVEYVNNFYAAGKDAAEGFANGLNCNDSLLKVKIASAAMAKAAEDAARAQLDEHSPSKVFEGIGNFAGQGFVNALNNYRSIAGNAASNMANSAIKGVSNAISKIKDVVEGKIDSQPTIRPVLDLSDVNSGVGALSGMLNLSPSVGVRADLSSISASMDNRQNGVDSGDIVSAIYDLKKSMGSMSGDVYNVNGITYDDGSNITEAVKSLVHAAKIERRI